MLKATFIFVLQRSSWSETHYSTSTTTFDSFAKQCADLANLRVALLGAGAFLDVIRMADTTHPRDTQDVDPNTYTAYGPYFQNPPTTVAGRAQVDSDQPNASVMCRVYTNGVPKNLYLAGCPDDVIGTDFASGENLTPNFNVLWYTNFQAWAGINSTSAKNMVGGRWGMLAKAPTNPQGAIATVPTGPYASYAAVQTVGPLAGVVGSKVLIKGFRSINPRLKGLSGTYKILAIPSTNLYVLANTTAAEVANVKPLPGTAYDLAYQVDQYTSVVFRKGTTRKRGGRSGLSLGRVLTRK